MAVTKHSYTASSGTEQGPYNYTFLVVDNGDIKVSVNGVVKTVTTHYTIDTSQKRVTFVSGQYPTAGDNVIVYRDTDEDPITNTFVSGSTIRSNELNDNFKQILYLAQEADNQALSTLGGTMSGTLHLDKDQVITFEGSTGGDSKITTLTVENPTANRTLTLPNKTGALVSTGDTGTVTGTMIANATITQGQMATDSVSTDELAANSVTTTELANAAVQTENIATDGVRTVNIQADAVNGAKIADNAIDSEHYTDGSIDRVHLAADIIDGTKIADDAIDSEHYANLSIDTAHIADRQITAVKIATGTITQTELATDSVSSDEIAANSVTTSELANSAVQTENIATDGVRTTNIQNDAVTGAKIADNAIDSDHYVDGSIDRVHLAADIVDGTKIADDSINSEHYAAGSIDLEHMSANSVDSDQYVDGSIDLVHMSANSVDSDQYVDGSIDRVHLSADIIDATKIADDAVTTDHIQDAELVTLAGMQTGTASKLADSTALTADIADLNQIDGMTKETSVTDDDAKFPTSGAVVDYVAAQLAPVGGFEVIATDAAFPNTQPSSGVVISIADAGGLVVNSSGTSTTGRTANGTTVTINNINSQFNSTTIDAGVAMMVSSTGSGHIYNYHKATLKEADLLSLSGDINDFAERYRVSGTAPSSSLDEGDLWWDTATDKLKVYDGSSWDEVASSGDFYINTISSYSGTGGNSATFNGSAYRFVLSNPGSTAQQHVVSINGVIQKPNSGTSQPSEGFVIDGSSIIFSNAPATGSDYFILTLGTTVSIGTPSDNTVATAKLQNLAVTTPKIAADAVDGTKIADNAIDSEHYTDGSIDLAHMSANSVDSDQYVDGSIDSIHLAADVITGDKIADNAVGAEHIEDLDANVQWLDSKKAVFGFDGDLEIYHDNTNARIYNSTGSTICKAAAYYFNNAAGTQNCLDIVQGDAVTLYYNNSKKFETQNDGCQVSGHLRLASDGDTIRIGADGDLLIHHSSGNSYLENSTGNLILKDTSGSIYLQSTGIYIQDDTTNENIAKFISDGACELYYNNSKKFETTDNGVEITGQLVSSNITGHNIIVNGAMQVAQHGTSSSTNSDYVCDRWRTSWAGSDEVTTQTQVALTSSDTGPWAKGLRYALQLTNGNQTGGAGGSDKLEIRYRAEAQDIASSGWDYTSTSSYITLSFWVKSSVAQNFYGIVKSVDGTALSYPISTGVLTANTWTKLTKIIPGNSSLQFNNDNGNGLEIIFFQMLGTNFTGTPTLGAWGTYSSSARTPATTTTFWTTNDATFALTGVQLEVGKGATEFEHLRYAEDLRRCQRYRYCHAIGADKAIGLGVMTQASELFVSIPFPVPMRTDPSVDDVTGTDYYKILRNNDNDTFTKFTKGSATTNLVGELYNDDEVGANVNNTGFVRTNQAGSRLTFDAEL